MSSDTRWHRTPVSLLHWSGQPYVMCNSI